MKKKRIWRRLPYPAFGRLPINIPAGENLVRLKPKILKLAPFIGFQFVLGAFFNVAGFVIAGVSH